MEATSLGAHSPRSSKTKGHGNVSPTASRTAEPRHTPPLFLVPSATNRSATVPVHVTESLGATEEPSSSSKRLLDPSTTTTQRVDTEGKQTDNMTSSGGREMVVQLNDSGTTEVVVDGGKLISGGDDSGLPAAGIAPTD